MNAIGHKSSAGIDSVVLMGKRGFGHVYLRGSIWWIKYHRNGEQKFESSESTEKEAANNLLKKRLAELNAPMTPARVTVGQLLDALLEDCKDRQLKTADTFWTHYCNMIRPYWGKFHAVQVTTEKLTKYQKKRVKDGAQPATINRELAVMRRAFKVGQRLTPPLVGIVPHFPKMPERNARRGFLEQEGYRKMLAALPEDVQPLLVVGYHTGARMGELLGLRWSQVNLEEGTITLQRGETKNDEPRTLPIYGDMAEHLERLKASKGRCRFVFHRAGKPIKDFRHSWEQAAIESGNKGLMFHDLRRSAVRNMVRAGVPERIVMAISGHKTRSIFDRYNIVNTSDVIEAARKTTEFLKQKG